MGMKFHSSNLKHRQDFIGSCKFMFLFVIIVISLFLLCLDVPTETMGICMYQESQGYLPMSSKT